MADELSIANFHAVDCANDLCGTVQMVEVRDNFLFVGDGDVESLDVFLRNPLAQVCHAVHLIKTITCIGDALALEHRLKPLLRPRVRQFFAYQTILFHGAKIRIKLKSEK